MTGNTMTGAAMGTLVYMPRQQILDFKYAKPEVDVWAAAASVYNLITGFFAKPFMVGEEPMKVVLTKDALPIRQRDAKVPAAFAQVIDKALVDKVSLHYSTAKQIHMDVYAVYNKLYK